MAKNRHVRIRSVTYERLAETAEEMDLNVSELADRVLSDYLDSLEEIEENENGNEDDDEVEECPACGESIEPDFRYCPQCGEELEE